MKALYLDQNVDTQSVNLIELKTSSGTVLTVIKHQNQTSEAWKYALKVRGGFRNEYKVYNKMSSTLSKVSKKVRKDKETSQSLNKLEEQLKNGEFHTGRGAEKLPGIKTVYYMRAGNKARLFFRYSEEEKGAVEKLAESNKEKEQEVIDNLKQNYK